MEIDHIRDDSADLANLQLLCADCHHAKTTRRMVPASAEQQAMCAVLCARRVPPNVRALLCDDEQQWQASKKACRHRQLDRIDEVSLDVDDFRGSTRAEMIAAIDDELDTISEALDPRGWSVDDDSGFGPYTYFAHAMAKDD